LESRKKRRDSGKELNLSLFAICKRIFLWNTLTAYWWMVASMTAYYPIWGLFPTQLQRDLGLPPLMIGLPLAVADLVGCAGICI
jgi:hypothetical protein